MSGKTARKIRKAQAACDHVKQTGLTRHPNQVEMPLRVTVVGRPKTGKTTVGLVIADALRAQGFAVDFRDQDGPILPQVLDGQPDRLIGMRGRRVVVETRSVYEHGGFREKLTLSGEEFVRVWQNAASVQEVADRFGMALGTAMIRACRYRKSGTPLKMMYRGPGQRAQSALAEVVSASSECATGGGSEAR